MKLRPEQLDDHLKRGLAPVYWLSGDEPLLLQEASDAVRHAAKIQHFTEREIFHADASFDWDELLASTNSLSLFSEKKIMDVRLSAGKLGSDATHTITALCKNPSPDTLVIITSPKIDSAGQRSANFKLIEQHGVIIQVWPINLAQLPSWINTRLKQRGITAHTDVGRLLAERVEGNLLAANQEIGKLALVSDGQTITVENLTAVADHARYDVFTLVDCILLGEGNRAVKILHGLQSEGSEPSVILWALVRELRQLIAISHAAAQGSTIDSACDQQRVFDKRKPLIKQALRRHSTLGLEKILQKTSHLDKSIKGLRQENVWDQLSAITLHIAGIVTPLSKITLS